MTVKESAKVACEILRKQAIAELIQRVIRHKMQEIVKG